MSKDSYYFKHDTHARHDPKIKSLINKYGVEGYGRWWIVVEMLREQSGYKIEDAEFNWLALAEDMKTSVDEVKRFLEDCVTSFRLLVREENFFYSAALLKKMVDLDNIRIKRQAAGIIGNSHRWGSDDDVENK